MLRAQNFWLESGLKIGGTGFNLHRVKKDKDTKFQ